MDVNPYRKNCIFLSSNALKIKRPEQNNNARKSFFPLYNLVFFSIQPFHRFPYYERSEQGKVKYWIGSHYVSVYVCSNSENKKGQKRIFFCTCLIINYIEIVRRLLLLAVFWYAISYFSTLYRLVCGCVRDPVFACLSDF